MTRRQLFKELNILCKNLHDKYCINCGGCCLVAAYLAEGLELCNIPFEIVHFDECGCHWAIKVSDRYLNRGDYRTDEITEIIQNNSKFLYAIYYGTDWNDTYDTDYNDLVHESLRKVFNHYLKK